MLRRCEKEVEQLWLRVLGLARSCNAGPLQAVQTVGLAAGMTSARRVYAGLGQGRVEWGCQGAGG